VQLSLTYSQLSETPVGCSVLTNSDLPSPRSLVLFRFLCLVLLQSNDEVCGGGPQNNIFQDAI